MQAEPGANWTHGPRASQDDGRVLGGELAVERPLPPGLQEEGRRGESAGGRGGERSPAGGPSSGTHTQRPRGPSGGGGGGGGGGGLCGGG
mmetsp:Transcript_46677/g.146298  ORF Transcript_46677/g.146298 Transcript_46677/m.146298 type:complete len:90 (-) Transcript_46677:451-720(-)